MSSFRDLQKYIYLARRKGLTREEVRKNLKDAGWNELWVTLAERWLRLRTKKTTPSSRGIFSSNGPSLPRTTVLVTVGFVLCVAVYFTFAFCGAFFLKGPNWFRPDKAIAKQLGKVGSPGELQAKITFSYTDRQANGSGLFALSGDGDYELNKNGQETASINAKVQRDSRKFSAKFVLRSSEEDGTIVLVSPDADLAQELSLTSNDLLLEGKWLKINNQPLGLVGSPYTHDFLSGLTVSKYVGTKSTNGNRELLYEAIVPTNVRFGFSIPNREDIGVQEYQDLLRFDSVIIGVSPMSFSIRSVTLNAKIPSVQSIITKLSHKGLSPVKLQDDQQRLSDMQSIANELERYYNKFGGYPKGVKGRPLLVRDFTWPTAPPAQNTCSEYYNTYWYSGEGVAKKQSEDGPELYPSYRLTFCLGGAVGSKQPGVNALTPSGVYLLSCENDPYCTVPEKQFRDIIRSESFWRGIPLDSNLTLELHLKKD